MDTGVLFIALGLTGLVISLYYWAVKSVVAGLLSILVMLGTGAYWLVLETTLPILSYVWITIGLVNLFDFIYRVLLLFGDQIADRYGYSWDFLRDNKDDA